MAVREYWSNYGGNWVRIFSDDEDDIIHGTNITHNDLGEVFRDVIWGGGGNDTIYAYDGDDTIYDDGYTFWTTWGTPEHRYDPTIIGHDTIYAGAGNDRVYIQGGHDEVHGGDGDDRISGELDSVYGDVIYGDGGNDLIIGGNADDVIYGGDGNDTIRGDDDLDNQLNPTLTGEDVYLYGHDELHGGAGNDSIRGYFGNNSIYGDEGNDSLWGGYGADIIYGGIGNDYLFGGESDDTLDGEDGDDTLSGWDGNDILHMSAGVDSLTGGDGGDRFVFNGATVLDGVNISTIEDFDFAEGDVLDLSGLLSAHSIAGDRVHDYIIVSESGAHTTLSFDASGTGDAASAVDFVVLRYVTDVSVDAAGLLVEGAVAPPDPDPEGDPPPAPDPEVDLIGTSADDVLVGGDTDDFIDGNGGNDQISGGAGNDILEGGSGDDVLDGGAGHDVIYLQGGNETVTGGAGADQFIVTGRYLSLGNNLSTILDLNFAEGDTLNVAEVVSRFGVASEIVGDHFSVREENGNTIILADSTADHNGTRPQDMLLLQGVTGVVVDDDGNVVLAPPPPVPENDPGDHDGDGMVTGLDFLFAQRGNGNTGNVAQDIQEWEQAFPSPAPAPTPAPVDLADDGDFDGNGVVSGLDFLRWQTAGGNGQDLQNWSNNYGVTEAPVEDPPAEDPPPVDPELNVIEGTDGLNTLYGTSDDDLIMGLGGNDTLWGKAGDDVLMAGDGQDTVYASEGHDTLTGGSGVDQFIFWSSWFDMGQDMATITDFSVAEGDSIYLMNYTGFDQGQDAIDDFIIATESGGNTTLAFDATGTGNAATAVDFAILEGVTNVDLETIL